MYKLCQPNPQNNAPASSVIRLSDGACIPFDSANTDYQAFKKAVNEGADLQDADGDLMTAEQAKEYVATLP